MKNNNQGLLSSDFVLLTTSSFLYFFNFHGYILLPVKINILGGSESDIGFIMGAASLSTIISTPLAGYLVDRYLRKGVMYTGSVLLIISGLCLIYLEELNIYYSIIRFIQGISFSFYFVSAGTLITDISPDSRRTQALGIFGVFTIINYAIAPYVGRQIIEIYGFNVFFLMLSSFGLLSMIFLIPVNEFKKYTLEQCDKSPYINSLTRYTIIITALTLFFVGSGFIPTLTFLPVFSLILGITEYEIFFICYTISVLFVRILAGWVPDKIGKLRIVYPSLILFCSGIFYLGYAVDKLDLILCSILFGLGHGFLYPTLYSLMIDNSEVSTRGKLFSLCSVSFTFGGMAGSFIYGVVADYYDYFFMFRLMGLVSSSGLVLFLIYNFKYRST